MQEKVSRVKLIVVGRVQGVFFRQSTRETARKLGLVGWVRNENDGSVAIEAAGAQEQIQNLIEWCHQGPPSARVAEVKVEWLASSSESEKTFEIVY